MSTDDMDPVAERIQQVALLVRDLRSRINELEEDLADARRRADALATERATVRTRVRRMLDYVGG